MTHLFVITIVSNEGMLLSQRVYSSFTDAVRGLRDMTRHYNKVLDCPFQAHFRFCDLD